MTYTRGGHRVARYDSAIAAYPSVMEFSGEGELVPVTLVYAEPAFAKGGLVDTAEMIKRAGRNGDTEIVHVNKQELAELREMWGEPTINPQTGCPEYFLKKAWKGIKKIAKPLARIAPLAAMFIPSIGPLAAAGIGALSGGVTGGLKGALVGGALGGLGASGAVGKAIGSVAPRLSPVAARAAQGAVLGGLGSAAQGGNVLNGALTGGALGAAIGPGGLINPRATTITGAPLQGPASTGAMSVNAPGISGASTNPFNVQVNGGEIGLSSSGVSGVRAPVTITGSSNNLAVTPPDLSPLNIGRPDLSSLAVDRGQSWLNRPFLGISDKIPNKIGVPIAGALALNALSKPSGGKVQDFRNAGAQELIDAKLQPVFSQKELPPPKSPVFSNLGVKPRPQRSLEEQYMYASGPEQAFFDYVQEPVYAARGGSVRSEYAVKNYTGNIGGYDYMPGEYEAYARVDRLRDALDKLSVNPRATPEQKAMVAQAYLQAESDAAQVFNSRASSRPQGDPTSMSSMWLPDPEAGAKKLRSMDNAIPTAREWTRDDAIPFKARGGSFAVEGAGDGREDLIDAKLSDGEYVIDAETVALLGNGSSKAGAKALDAMRVNLRKHKGRNLAKGSFSVKAKAPERYMVKAHG